MFIFGGILEVTKELNDLLVYDFKTQKLSVHEQREGGPDALAYASKLEETIAKNSVNDGANSPHRGKTLAGSPLRKGMSPNRRSTMGNHSPTNTSALSKSPTKKTAAVGGTTVTGDKGGDSEKGLSSPTSVSMQNSFIIKNADESFDHYYQQMKRRRHLVSGFQDTMGAGIQEKVTTFQRGRKPNARDGHSANVDKFGFMFVFGGDRHQMPFNDLFLIKLPK